MSPVKLLALAVATALLALAALGVPALASGPGAAAQAAKKCKGHKRCHPSFHAGQPCQPSKAKLYAKAGFLCLPQPSPDGTTSYQLVKSQA